MPGNLHDVLAITSLIQCLVKALSDEIDQGAYQHDCHPMMVRQNKWRACRYGNRAELVNSYTYDVQSVPEIVGGLITRLESTAKQLDCLPYLQDVQRLANGPDQAEAERELLRELNDPVAVVRRFVAESRVSPLPLRRNWERLG